MLGAVATVLDATDQAVRLYGQAMDHLRRTATAGTNATLARALALVLFDSGAWTAAQSAAEDACWTATEAGADNVTVGSQLLQATLRAAQGDHAAAHAGASGAVRGLDLRKSRNLYVRYRQARGTAFLAESDHQSAYEQLRQVFTRDFHTEPVHYHVSLYCLSDLAAAAVRAGQVADARVVLHAAERAMGASRSVRLDAIVHRASALLGDADEAESHFRAATDPVTARWPFEHALA
ncbi:hypothetical protein ABZ192_40725 [Streptomyces sp. NPDC006235]|uniref:hypothetical protein n=1 Tax=Streptomyces sp. NPDC006235 TaxID=3156736 RepID=UPI0033A6FFA7